VDYIVLSERTYDVNPLGKILYCQDTHRMSNRCAKRCTAMTCTQCETIGQ
jgi:hypothetical protein